MNKPSTVVALPGRADESARTRRGLERLLRGQQALLARIVEGMPLAELLSELSQILEQVLAPWHCRILLNRANEVIFDGPALSGLANMTDNSPVRAAIEAQTLTVVPDFQLDVRWPLHAAGALVAGWRCCASEPLGDCGDELTGAVTAYRRVPGPPDADTAMLLAEAAAVTTSLVKTAEHSAALCATRDRFASLSAAVPGVVYQRRVRPDGDIRYTYISEGARDLFGVSAQEILSDPDALFRRHSEDYKAKFRERLITASNALTMWDVEATIVKPDGSKVYTHAIARPQRQDDGSVLWTGIILDETRTREALVDSLSQGFLLFDADDRLVMGNSHFLELFPSLRDTALPGTSYEEIVLGEIASLRAPSAGDSCETSAFRERMRRHGQGNSLVEQQLTDDRWILVSEQRSREGGTVVLYTDISELRRRERDLRHLAFHDSLTGLPNRALFQERVTQSIAQARLRGTAVAVMCLDLDHFKNVNDTLGHPAGDALLRSVAERLIACCRDNDTVARLGGDEFGIILMDLDSADTATMISWRLLEAIGKPVDFHGQQMVTGLSIGIAVSSTDGETAEEIVKRADLALYRAKADGRGTFRFFESEMDARAQARRSLELDLRQALTLEQLELHYQPQIDVSTDEVVGFEALVRWRHPERGLVSPNDFIPLAEETGLIVKLGEWVLRRACTDALQWPNSVRVAVNVSPAQFRHRNLTPLVAKVLQETGLEPERLEIEITESLLLRDVRANLVTLHSLKALGIRISMDDFGTGYSSLGNLRSFPFDKIKIDRSFVGDLERSQDAAAIVHAVLGLGQSLGMSTCAEGVETSEQLSYLRDEGCTEVQGFYYSKPRPAADIAELLATIGNRRLTPADVGCSPVRGYSPAPLGGGVPAGAKQGKAE